MADLQLTTPGVEASSSQVSSLDLDQLEQKERHNAVSGGARQNEGQIVAQTVAIRLQTTLSARTSAMRIDEGGNGSEELRSATYKSVKTLVGDMLRADKSYSTHIETILLAEAKQRCRSAYIAHGLQEKVKEASDLLQQHMRRLGILYEQRDANRKHYLKSLDEIHAKHDRSVAKYNAALSRVQNTLDEKLAEVKEKHTNFSQLKGQIVYCLRTD